MKGWSAVGNLIGILCVALGVVAWPIPADACSGPGCADPWRPVPGPGGQVPSNAPALGLVMYLGLGYESLPAPSPLVSVRSSPDAGVALVRSDGGLVAVTLEKPAWANRMLIRPQQPLEPGASYQLEFGDQCPYGADAGSRFAFEVHAGPAANIPGSPGQLSVQTMLGRAMVPAGSICRSEEQAAVAQFSFTPAAEMLPWMPLAGWALKVDGVVWAAKEPGWIDPTGTAASVGPYSSFRDLLQVYALCNPSSSMIHTPGLAQGQHEAVLEARVIGLDASIATPPVTFHLDCGGDGGLSDGGHFTASRDQTSGMAGAGCSTSLGGPVLLLTMLLVSVRLRRRS